LPSGRARPQPGLPPQVLELEERGKRAGILSLFLNSMLITILTLMVWKPA